MKEFNIGDIIRHPKNKGITGLVIERFSTTKYQIHILSSPFYHVKVGSIVEAHVSSMELVTKARKVLFEDKL